MPAQPQLKIHQVVATAQKMNKIMYRLLMRIKVILYKL